MLLDHILWFSFTWRGSRLYWPRLQLHAAKVQFVWELGDWVQKCICDWNFTARASVPKKVKLQLEENPLRITGMILYYCLRVLFSDLSWSGSDIKNLASLSNCNETFHSLSQIRRNIKAHLVPSPLPRAETSHWTSLHTAPSNKALNISRDEAFWTSPHNPFQCLTTLWVKNFFLLSLWSHLPVTT